MSDKYKIFYSDKFIVYAPSRLAGLVDAINKSEKYNTILKFFNKETFNKTKINIFDTRNEFLSYLSKIEDVGNYPSYCKANIVNDMINISIEDLVDDSKILTRVFHEFTHLVYKSIYSKREVWFDEGLAMYLSGQMQISDVPRFINEKIENKAIFNLNELDHRKNFVGNGYNGYYLSYIAVRYIIDTISHNEIIKLLTDYESLEKMGENILDNVYNYYKIKKSWMGIS